MSTYFYASRTVLDPAGESSTINMKYSLENESQNQNLKCYVQSS